ncbi:MAG: hypothetical protein ACYCVY_11755 [Acidiferrobacteraceae bacterium]
MKPSKPESSRPEPFDFPTPQETDRAKKSGIVVDTTQPEDFSQLTTLLDDAD